MKNFIFTAVLIFCVSSTAWANPRKSNPIGLHLGLGGPTGVLAGSLNVFALPSVAFEGGGGVLGYFGGGRIHFNGSSSSDGTFYLGAYYSKIFGIFSKDVVGGYIPVGYHVLRKSGYSSSVEIAARTHGKGTPVWGGVKIGYHF